MHLATFANEGFPDVSFSAWQLFYRIYRREIKVHLISSSREQSPDNPSREYFCIAHRVWSFVLLFLGGCESSVNYFNVSSLPLSQMLTMISATALSPFSTELFRCTLPQLPVGWIPFCCPATTMCLTWGPTVHILNDRYPCCFLAKIDQSAFPFKFSTNTADEQSQFRSSEQESSFYGPGIGPQIGESFVAKVKEASRWKLNGHDEKSQTGASESILEEEIA